jgi:hypothetical protein
MQITLSFDNFTELPYTSGTIQNISSQATVEICQDDTVNSGLILGPGEWFSWSNATIYARSAWDYEPTATCAVVPFLKGGEGGGSEYVLPIATASTLGGVKIGSGLTITVDGTLSATGGGGSGSWQQVTKLNVTAPIDVKIDIPYTDTFISPPVEVLKYVSGTTDVTVNEFTFNGGDGSRFEVDGVTASESPLVTFDGVVKPNHDVKYHFGSAVKMVNKYYAESAEIDLDAFKIVSEVSLA